jgi:hypothetical protein
VSFGPQKFFIGLMDFFSILLPGALRTYLLMDEMGPPRYRESWGLPASLANRHM